MQGQQLDPEVYFLGRCDQKGGTLAGFGEIAVKFASKDLPERAGDLYLSAEGRISRAASGVYDLLLLNLQDPAEGEPWPRWEEIIDPFANPYVTIEELGRVELVREGGSCTAGGRGYTFTLQMVVATKKAEDFNDLLDATHDEAAMLCRRRLSLFLAGQYKCVLCLRDPQQDLPLGDANSTGE